MQNSLKQLSASLTEWHIVGIALIVFFPVLTLLLSEFITKLKQQRHPLVATLSSIRNLFLPTVVILLMLRYVVELPAANMAVKFAYSAFWLVLIHAALSLLNALLFVQAPEASWQARVPTLLRNISRFVLILIGVAVLASSVWGANLSGVLAALGVGSIVIGLALQDTLSSFIAGLLLLAERPFNEGEVINAGEVSGTVLEMNWRAVRLRAFDGRLVIIPNGVLASQTIRNLTRCSPIRESFQIGFSYNDPPNKAKQILMETVLASTSVMSEPKPIVRTLEYADFSINYEVFFWIENANDLLIARDDFITKIWYAASRHGLTIPFPTQTEYSVDLSEEQERLTQRRRSSVQQQLAQYLSLDADALAVLAATLSTLSFSKGEYVVRQGGLSSALYVVLNGQASAIALDSVGKDLVVSTLTKGDYFGSMAMLRGSPSELTLKADTDLELLLIDSRTALELTHSQPGFATALEQMIDARRQNTERLLESERRRRSQQESNPAGNTAASDPASFLSQLLQLHAQQNGTNN